MGSNEQRQQPCYSTGSGIVIRHPQKAGMKQWHPPHRDHPHHQCSDQLQNIHHMELPLTGETMDSHGQHLDTYSILSLYVYIAVTAQLLELLNLQKASRQNNSFANRQITKKLF